MTRKRRAAPEVPSSAPAVFVAHGGWWMPDTTALADNLRAALPRVGVGEAERLGWVVRWASRLADNEHALDKLTQGDWLNATLELAVFAGSGLAGTDIILPQDQRGAALLPTQNDVQEILTDFKNIIGEVVRRGRNFIVALEPLRQRWYLTWSPARQRFSLNQGALDVAPEWRTNARHALARLLVSHGHRVKACPAPRPWGGGAACGTWFVAARPRQEYCTPKCQSRATTQANRHRSKTPATIRREAQHTEQQETKGATAKRRANLADMLRGISEEVRRGRRRGRKP